MTKGKDGELPKLERPDLPPILAELHDMERRAAEDDRPFHTLCRCGAWLSREEELVTHWRAGHFDLWQHNAVVPAEEVQKTFVVLGCGRSGTSLVAGLLHGAGVHMGSFLIPARATPSHAPLGLFEDERFNMCNSRILGLADGSWAYPPSVDAIMRIDSSAFVAPIVAAERQAVWGWKDPRTALTITHWAPLIAGLHPQIVVTHRNPLSIARSMRRVWGITLNHGLYLASVYEDRIISFLNSEGVEGWPVFHVAFEGLHDPEGGELERLAEFCELDLDAGFVVQGLRHF